MRAGESALDIATDDVLVCSTGLIGIPMPMDALEAGVPKLCGTGSPRPAVMPRRAILTTDTVRKGGRAWRAGRHIVGGMAKGAAMLSPAMATMLAVLTTDAAVERPCSSSRSHAVSETFDCLSVDGCRSTNDTVMVLANGRGRGRTAR